jgi:hypothetical protein
VFAKKPAEGARTSIFLASSPEVEGVTGKYFADCKMINSSPLSHDVELGKKLWDISLEKTSRDNSRMRG